ncbi:Putative short-chain dehydrogenase/reductase SDR, NAD(P)-binding domain superfamily [Septoria linicola]|uniref:Short-chain dehydrogenase/reductase SDR, NAD(P)-binding domain superfamily n=1 Tax=Septoria linicola TaxID=215465 RepID=A0A9Q9EPF8_9PEZI|nr:Putative short-chain dehydrogenase/reductase SDR, NAD(P)-binding domain superfamily [Septoria linicola]
MSNKPLAGKVAVVTGAGRGIGRAIALDLAKRGVKGIAITYHSNVTAANAVISELKELGASAIAIKDVSPMTSEFTDSIIQQTLSAFSALKVDILINNAATAVLADPVTPEVFNQGFNTNVLAPLLLTQSILPHIARGGSIVNISSASARWNLGGPTNVYASSKAALEHLTRNLAADHAEKYGITINAGRQKSMCSLIGIATAEKRAATPEEIADAVGWLCGGGGARWINGHTIASNGGSVMW